jgi:ribonuclease HII
MKTFFLNCNEVGTDEAGRGTLIGNVYAGAVIWDNSKTCELIKDSKKITPQKRNIARKWIEENLKFGIGFATNEEVDEINILNASHLAMHRAIQNLIDKYKINIEHIIIDGNSFKKFNNVSHHCIIKGDDKFLSIASASILAKEYHDDHIREICKKYNLSNYDLDNNMGYGTKKHLEAIQNHGISELHRKTFKCCKK